MNKDAVAEIAKAVLYEGYLLYPYRASSVKNRQRWTFGGLYPKAYSQAQGGSDLHELLTECLVHGRPDTIVEVRVRFLHLLERCVEERGEDGEGRVIESRQEAVEREVAVGEVSSEALLGEPHRSRFLFPGSQDRERRGAQEVVRRQEPIEGVIEVMAVRVPQNPSPPAPLPEAERGVQDRTQARSASEGSSPAPPLRFGEGVGGRGSSGVGGRGSSGVGGRGSSGVGVRGSSGVGVRGSLGEALFKLSVRVSNTTSLAESIDRDEALLRSLVSTHVVLGVRQGAFVSLMGPPEPWREAAADCRNVGVWPVLVGAEGDNDTMLASPIILYDHPRIAPESPGDLFDGTEIDEILTLRILALTEGEKQEVNAGDALGRDLIARTESLAREQLLGLHGTFRGLKPVPDSSTSEQTEGEGP